MSVCKKCRTFAPANAETPLGEMVEWSITAVLKTAVLRGTGGSNPSLSALISLNPLIFQRVFYFFHSDIYILFHPVAGECLTHDFLRVVGRIPHRLIEVYLVVAAFHHCFLVSCSDVFVALITFIIVN